MPPFERGVYEPGEEVRVFDGSEDDEDVEGSRLPLLIVLALLVLAMFGGVVWLAYTQGVARGRTETPVVAAANGPARIAPATPGGAEQPYKGFKIYEQPAPPDDDTSAANGATTPAGPAKAPPAATVAAPQKISPPPAPKPAITTAAAAPKPAAMAPAPKPVVAPANPPAPVAAQAAPLKIAPATAPPRALTAAPKPIAASPKVVVASGSTVLQIGAYKSQADADNAWKSYRAKHAALLAGYNPDVQQADLGEKGTWYRLRIAGLASKDVASALCDRLKADGGNCFLGK
jgi:cell division protein FtsN